MQKPSRLYFYYRIAFFIHLNRLAMRLKAFFLLPLLLISFFSYAQQLEVTGTITSLSDGFPLPGVTVQVKSNKQITFSTLSNKEGKYKIILSDPENQVLVFSFMGYLIEEVAVKNLAVVDVALTEDIETESDRLAARKEARAYINKKDE